MRETLRRVIMAPYLGDSAPTFTLTTWDTGRPHNGGPQWRLGYRLVERRDVFGCPAFYTIFEGEDYGCSPMCAIDSDDCLRDLLGFLTLRPGDTDDEYFERYTPFQLAFAEKHAEILSMYADEEDPPEWDTDTSAEEMTPAPL